MSKTKMRPGEPPPGRTTAHDWSAIAATMKANPNTWYEVFVDDRYSLVAAVSSGAVAAFRPGDDGLFEVRTTNNRNVEESDSVTRRHCDLWMQFIPTTKKKRGK